MGVNSLLNTVTRQRRGCDLNPGPSAPESSALTTRLPSEVSNHKMAQSKYYYHVINFTHFAAFVLLWKGKVVNRL